LVVASQEGHCDIVKCLLISGADINLLDEYGQSPLFVASQEGHCDIPELSKNLTISQCPCPDAKINGDSSQSLHLFISTWLTFLSNAFTILDN
jgi:ankyrin repeat protein